MSPEFYPEKEPTRSDLITAIRKLVEKHAGHRSPQGDIAAEGELVVAGGYDILLNAERIVFKKIREGESAYVYIALYSSEGDPTFIEPDMDPSEGIAACGLIEDVVAETGSAWP